MKTMKTIKTGVQVVLFVVLGAGYAFSGEDHDRAKRLKETGDILPLEKIAEKAAKEYPGRILEVELEEENQLLIYELDILDEKGVLWKLKIDARSGELIRRKEGSRR